jgi:hypothetical protein
VKLLLELVRIFFWNHEAPDPKEAIMAEALNGNVLHVRFEGRSLDVPLHVLDVGPASDDAAIKRALAGQLELPEARLRDYVIDRHETGNLTVRPEAVFG